MELVEQQSMRNSSHDVRMSDADCNTTNTTTAVSTVHNETTENTTKTFLYAQIVYTQVCTKSVMHCMHCCSTTAAMYHCVSRCL
jgi:hypothetical protein